MREFFIPLELWRDARFRAAWEARSTGRTWVESPYFDNGGYCPEDRDKRSMRNRFRKILHKLEPVIFARDGKRCGHCARVRGVELRIDHVLPISWGGSNEIWNLQVLCHRCNTLKGDRLPDSPRPSAAMLVNLLRKAAT